MIQRTFFIVLYLSFIGINNKVVAEEQEPNPVLVFVLEAQLAFKICKVSMQTDLLGSELGETYPRYYECLDNIKAEIKSKYQASKEIVPSNTEAENILKNFYAFWLTAMDGLIPLMDERKIAYENRINENESELARLGKRLEIELGLE